MSKVLTFEVADEVYEACQQMVAQYGGSAEEYALEFMLRYGPKPRPKLTEEEAKAALDRLLRHAGAENLGYPTGADNESIDADLAQEYGNTHEEEA
jgi:hypothetical protein